MPDSHRNGGSLLPQALADVPKRAAARSNPTSMPESRNAPPVSRERLRVVGELDRDGHHFLIVEAASGAAAPRAPARERPASQRDKPAIPQVLTPRELQIAALVARGQLNKQIAARLRISEFTVCAHLRHIFWKLSIKRRSALASLYAASVGASVRDD